MDDTPAFGCRRFRQACESRGLDPDTMPRQADAILGILQAVVGIIGVTAASEPGLMQWFAAGLEALAGVADSHAEIVFREVADHIFGGIDESGGTS